MEKNIVFWLFTMMTLLAFAYGLALGGHKLNEKRLSLAGYYSEQSRAAKNSVQKNLWLIKSDAIDPTPQKKISIALYYLLENQPEKAKNILLFVNNQESAYLLAEYYILNEPERASEHIQRITNTTVRDELAKIREIALGRNQAEPIGTAPRTDLGMIFRVASAGDLLENGQSQYLDGIIAGLPDNTNPNMQALDVSAYLLKQGQPYLAIYNTELLEARVGSLASTNELKAQSYAMTKDYRKATELQAIAIALEPEVADNYRVGIIYAREGGDTSRANFWSERLRELSSMQK